MKCRIGVVGSGRWSQIFIKELSARPDLGLVASLYGSELPPSLPESILFFQRTPDHAHRSAFLKSGLDGVIIANDPQYHYDSSLWAIEAGIPILLEKPITLNLRQAQELALKSKAARIPILVDHIHLFHPAFEALREQLHGQTILNIKSQNGGTGPDRGYNSLWDYGPHELAIHSALAGSLINTANLTHKEVQNGGANYEVALSFDNLNTSFVCGNRFATKTRRLDVDTDRNRFSYDTLSPHILTRDGIPQAYRPISALQSILELFTQELDHPRDPRWSLDLAVNTIQILDSLQSATQLP